MKIKDFGKNYNQNLYTILDKNILCNFKKISKIKYREIF